MSDVFVKKGRETDGGSGNAICLISSAGSRPGPDTALLTARRLEFH